MAVYPEGNPGEYPVDMSTNVGLFRLRVNDLVGTPYDPDYPGFANFVKAGDAEIEAFLASTTSVWYAVADFYQSLANDASLHSLVTKDHDLQLDQRDLAKALQAQSDAARASGDRERMESGDLDFYFSTGFGSASVTNRPEAAPPVV